MPCSWLAVSAYLTTPITLKRRIADLGSVTPAALEATTLVAVSGFLGWCMGRHSKVPAGSVTLQLLLDGARLGLWLQWLALKGAAMATILTYMREVRRVVQAMVRMQQLPADDDPPGGSSSLVEAAHRLCDELANLEGMVERQLDGASASGAAS